jgi:hypothetical protein
MFNSVKSNNISEHIIEQIRKTIFKGRVKPGDKLPAERELIENFGHPLIGRYLQIDRFLYCGSSDRLFDLHYFSFVNNLSAQ